MSEITSTHGLMGSDVARDILDHPGEAGFTTPITSGSTTVPIVSKQESASVGIFTATIDPGSFSITPRGYQTRGIASNGRLTAMRLFRDAPETKGLTELIDKYEVDLGSSNDLVVMKCGCSGITDIMAVKRVAYQFLTVLAGHWAYRQEVIERNRKFIQELPKLILSRVYRHSNTGDSVVIRNLFVPVMSECIYDLEDVLTKDQRHEDLMISFHEFGHPDYSVTYAPDVVGHHPPTIYAPLDTLLHHPEKITEVNDKVTASPSHDGLFMSVRSLDEIRVATDDDIVLCKVDSERGQLYRALEYAEEHRTMCQRCADGKAKAVADLEAQIKALDKDRNAIMKRIEGPKKTKKH